MQEALDASRQADAHWLTAHLVGHLGMVAKDRVELEAAAEHYHHARALAETIGDQRGATLWTLNLGIARYEQGRWDEALPLLQLGKEQAAAQNFGSLEAGADIFIGASLAAQGQYVAGLASVERGLAQAQAIQDQERILLGYLQRGRILALMGRLGEACAAQEEGLHQAEASQMQHMADYLRAEIRRWGLGIEA
ncbi:MAG: hypothetical protein N2508_11440 [Anaerolineae bacterium]|nr:hypothetical protein [Anaerolineae bacterium]